MAVCASASTYTPTHRLSRLDSIPLYPPPGPHHRRASSRIDLLADETDTAELRRFDELWRFDVCGTDGWGHPVVWDCTGSADFKRLLAELGEGRTVELFLRRLELLRRSKLLEAAKRGHAVYKHVWIVDLTGLSVGSLRRENRELLARAARSLNETYPESMLKVYVVNAPRLFSVGWRLLYPLLDPVSAAKFSIMGPLDEGCRAALAEAGVDADFLAASMGRAGARRSAA